MIQYVERILASLWVAIIPQNKEIERENTNSLTMVCRTNKWF